MTIDRIDNRISYIYFTHKIKQDVFIKSLYNKKLKRIILML